MTATKQSAGGNGAGEATALPTQAANSDQAYGHPMLDLQREFIVGIGRMQHEYATFVSDRVRKNIDIAKRMAECRDFKAALELQRNYVATAREDYTKEVAKLLAIAFRLNGERDVYIPNPWIEMMRKNAEGVIIAQREKWPYPVSWGV